MSKIINIQISLIFFISAFFLDVAALCAAEPFDLKLSYELNAHLLRVELTRLPAENMTYMMKKIVVYKDADTQMEEKMINQNHLEKVTKLIPFKADSGDVINVELYYNDEDVIRREIIVPYSTDKIYKTSEDTPQKGKSILVGSDLPVVESNSSVLESGNSKSLQQEMYGHEESEEKLGSAPYGYEKQKKEIGQEGYGYPPKKQMYGYSDPSHVQTNAQEYGYSESEEEQKKNPTLPLYLNDTPAGQIKDKNIKAILKYEEKH